MILRAWMRLREQPRRAGDAGTSAVIDTRVSGIKLTG